MDPINPVNVWTWNVNSIRSKIPLVIQLLQKHQIDILVVTETKIQPQHESNILIPGYQILFNSNKTASYHGVAIIYRSSLCLTIMGDQLPTKNRIKMVLINLKNANKISQVTQSELDHDISRAHTIEGRLLTVKLTIKNHTFVVVGTYVPNAGVDRTSPLKRLAYRTLCWDKDLFDHLLNLEKEYQKVIWLGDLNVARHDNDHNKQKSANFAGVTPEERYNFQTFLATSGWIDTWDLCNPDKMHIDERCTYGVNTTCRLRLDYVIVSPALRSLIKTSKVDQDFDGSDHVPMGTSFLF